MNHDYAHCLDYEKGVCPADCFLAELTDDLKNWPYPVAYSKFKDTEACPLTNPQPKRSNADRIRSMTDEELAKHLYYWDNSPLHASEERWLDWLRQEADT